MHAHKRNRLFSVIVQFAYNIEFAKVLIIELSASLHTATLQYIKFKIPMYFGFEKIFSCMQVCGCHFMLQSLNGIAVNGKKLKTLEPYILQDGDTVQLGVPAAPDASSEFVYRFFASLKVRKEPRSKHTRPGTEGASPAKRFKGSEKTEESRKEDEESEKPGEGAEAERYVLYT